MSSVSDSFFFLLLISDQLGFLTLTMARINCSSPPLPLSIANAVYIATAIIFLGIVAPQILFHLNLINCQQLQLVLSIRYPKKFIIKIRTDLFCLYP